MEQARGESSHGSRAPGGRAAQPRVGLLPAVIALGATWASGCGSTAPTDTGADAGVEADLDAGASDALPVDPSDCGIALEQSGSLDIDIPTVTVGGAITWNGGPIPQGGTSPQLRLARAGTAETGVLVDLGEARASGSTYQVRVVPGSYDVLYDYDACSVAAFPCQRGVRVRAGVSLTVDGTLDLDLRTARITGRATLDGASLPSASYDLPKISLRGGDGSTGIFADLEDLASGLYDVELLHGTYDLLYQEPDTRCSGDPFPCQEGVRLQSGVSVTGDGSLDLDIDTIRVTGRVTLDGANPPAASYEPPCVRLRGSDGSLGTLVDLDNAADGVFDARFLAGTYDLLYDEPDSDCTGTPYPCQERAVLRSGAAMTADGTLEVDIATLRVTGQVTLDGATPPASNSGRRPSITLRSHDGSGAGVLVQLEHVSGGAYDVRLLPGTYDLLYALDPAWCGGPPYPCQTGRVLLSGVTISTNGSLDVDIATRRLTGVVTLNGGALPATGTARPELLLRGSDASTGILARLQDAPSGSYDIRILPGEYDLLYRRNVVSCPTDPYPCQDGVVIREGQTIASDGSLDVDLPVLRLTGLISLDGEPLPAASSRGAIALIGADHSTGRLIDLDRTAGDTFDASVFAGIYAVLYDHLDPACIGTSYPCQRRALFACGGF